MLLLTVIVAWVTVPGETELGVVLLSEKAEAVTVTEAEPLADK